MSKIKKAKKVFYKILLKTGMIKQFSLFAVTDFQNIHIVPYEDLLDLPFGRSDHKGGPIWSVWNDTNNLRHKRDEYVDVRPTLPSTEDIYEEERELFWCGAIAEHYDQQSDKISGHFGHQVADFMSRIPAYKEYEKTTGKQGYYCFAVRNNSLITQIKDTPSYFQQILRWFEIDPTRVVIVNKPILAKKLLVTPQLECLNPNGPVLNDRYLSLLNEYVNSRLGVAITNDKTLYISRSAIKGGELAGESYLERFLEKNGVVVIHPEKLPLTEQIKMYREAKHLIFLEGSSLHCLQFLGKSDAKVYVINRRRGSNLMRSSLESRFPRVEYLDITDLVHGLSAAGKKARYDGISILNKNLLFKFFADVKFDSTFWEQEEFEKIQKSHLKIWYQRKEKAQVSGHKNSLILIDNMFHELGIKVEDLKKY